MQPEIAVCGAWSASLPVRSVAGSRGLHTRQQRGPKAPSPRDSPPVLGPRPKAAASHGTDGRPRLNHLT
eukprot:XP_001696134.1 predicted protein [Chlamydomonas reinhardtii]